MIRRFTAIVAAVALTAVLIGVAPFSLEAYRNSEAMQRDQAALRQAIPIDLPCPNDCGFPGPGPCENVAGFYMWNPDRHVLLVLAEKRSDTLTLDAIATTNRSLMIYPPHYGRRTSLPAVPLPFSDEHRVTAFALSAKQSLGSGPACIVLRLDQTLRAGDAIALTSALRHVPDAQTVLFAEMAVQ